MGAEAGLGPRPRVWNRMAAAIRHTRQTELLLRGSAGSLVLRGCSLGLRLLMGIALAWALGAAGYGVYAYAVTWLAVLTMPTALGLDQVVLRYVAVYRQAGSWPLLRGLLRWAARWSLAVSAGVAIAAMAVVAALGEDAADRRLTFVFTFAVLPLAVLAQVRQGALRGFDRPVLALTAENLVYPGLLLLLVGGAWLTGGPRLRAPQAALLNAGAWAGAFVVGTMLLLRALPARARSGPVAFATPEWRLMIPSLVLLGVAYHVFSRVDVLVLGAVRPSREVGVYVAASRGAELMLFAYDAVTVAGASLLSGIYATGDKTELQRFTSLAARAILVTSLPVYALLVTVAPRFLSWFGPEFVEGHRAMRILLTTYFLGSLGGLVHPALLMAGRQRDAALITAAMALVSGGLALALIPRLGIEGAAVASGSSFVLLKASLVYALYRREGVMSWPLPVHRAGGR